MSMKQIEMNDGWLEHSGRGTWIAIANRFKSPDGGTRMHRVFLGKKKVGNKRFFRVFGSYPPAKPGDWLEFGTGTYGSDARKIKNYHKVIDVSLTHILLEGPVSVDMLPILPASPSAVEPHNPEVSVEIQRSVVDCLAWMYSNMLHGKTMEIMQIVLRICQKAKSNGIDPVAVFKDMEGEP